LSHLIFSNHLIDLCSVENSDSNSIMLIVFAGFILSLLFDSVADYYTTSKIKNNSV
ncbi:hypothetical protein, partial [uncultured Gammaproteobacteria bacterium]